MRPCRVRETHRHVAAWGLWRAEGGEGRVVGGEWWVVSRLECFVGYEMLVGHDACCRARSIRSTMWPVLN